MTLGPGNSYVIVLPSKNVGSWGGLSSNLDNLLRENNGVRHVALGVEGAFAMLYEDRICHNFYAHYDALERVMANKGNSRITVRAGPSVA